MRGTVPRSLASVAVLSLVLLTGCGGDDDDTVAVDPTGTPSSTASASASASPTSDTSARAVYYIADTGPTGPRLYREFHARPATGDVLTDAVEAMLTEPAKDPDYTSLWPEGTTVNSVRVEGTTAIVDLSGEARNGSAGASFEAASLQQLVHTVTAAEPSVEAVQLLVDGSPTDTLWGHVDTSEPLHRAPAAEILGPVWILTPDEGGSIARGEEFGGTASVFEATVNWEWVQDGEVVDEGFSTATEGAPGRGEWSATVDVPPGDYVLRAFESSAKDGSVTFLDTKNVTVTD